MMEKMSKRTPTKLRIALLVDNPYRDLPGLVLVAWRLCQNGATCYLVPVNLRNNEVWSLAPDFILLNHFRTIYEDFVKNLMEAGILVGILDTEGSVFSPVPTEANIRLNNHVQNKQETIPAMEEYALSMVHDKQLRHKVATYCAWTPTFAGYANQAGWYHSEQTMVTGTPRMDFYAAQWHYAARCKSPFIDAYSEPIILINSNFTLANSCFQNPEEEVEMMVNTFSYDRDFVEKWRSTQDVALKALSGLANRLARHFPDVTFIYRPHPFEGEEIYKKLLEPLPNLHLVKKGTVDAWLLRAKALIHWGSSTAIDSCLAGVPAFSAGWIPMHLPIPALEAISIRCSSEDELIQRVSEILNDSFKFPSEIAKNIDSVVKSTFYKIDGYAHKRVADAILKAIESANSNMSIGKCHDPMYGRYYKTLKGRVDLCIRRILGLSVHWSFRHWRNIVNKLEWDHSKKYFDADRVKIIVDAIDECAQSGSKEPLRKVGVVSAQERGDYHFGFMQGRSVALFPE